MEAVATDINLLKDDVEVNELHAEPSQVGGLTAESLLEEEDDCDSCAI